VRVTLRIPWSVKAGDESVGHAGMVAGPMEQINRKWGSRGAALSFAGLRAPIWFA